MHKRVCRACGKLHDVDNWPVECARQVARSEQVKAPMFIRDCMDPVQSMLDGKYYTSKSALRETYKQAGVVEVGNDSSIMNPKPRPKVKPDRKKVRQSIDKAFSRAGLGA